MSVYKEPDRATYRYKFTIEGHRFRGSTGETSKAAALKVEKRLKHEAQEKLKHQAETRTKDMTMDQAADLYWERHAKHCSDADQIEGRILTVIRLIGANTLLGDIDNKMVDEFVAARRSERNQKYTGKNPPFIAHGTVNKDLGVLRAIMNRAKNKQDVFIRNIQWAEHKLLEPDHPDRPISVEQEEAIMRELVPHAQPIIEFMLTIGQRKTNCLMLDWSQVDMDNREIEFRVKSKKPGGRIEIVGFNDDLFNFFVRLGPKPKGRVFRFGQNNCHCPECRKRPGEPIGDIKRSFKAAVRRSGINRNVRFHDLRHTVGHRLLAMTNDIRLVQQYLAHSDIQSTMRYAKHSSSRKREAMDLLSKRGPARGPADEKVA